MKRVYICSRYRADGYRTVEDNIDNALRACHAALLKGYAPIAPHLIYPRCLDDNNPTEREAGMEAGLAWIDVCDELWQWGTELSEGMAAEKAYAEKKGIPIRIFDCDSCDEVHADGEEK